MKINELILENIQDVVDLQNRYNDLRTQSITIRNQIEQIRSVKPIKFSTSYKNYLNLRKKIIHTRNEFNQLIDEYILNINKLSIPTKQTWLTDFSNLKI